MIIYSEFLFIENFITGGLLLLLTAMMFGEKPPKRRILLAAILCGAAGFTVFVAAAGFSALFLHMGIAAAVTAVTFGIGTPKALAAKTVVFLALSLLSGGAVMAIMLWQEAPALSGAGVFYIQPLTYLRLICFGTIAFGFAYHAVRITKNLRIRSELCGTAYVTVDEERFEFSAMIDTGNYLKEPISGRPVVLIGKSAAKKLQTCIRQDRYILIPFSGAGVKNGILEGIRSDSISFGGSDAVNAVLAFYDGDFEESDLILGRDFLDRGIEDERILYADKGKRQGNGRSGKRFAHRKFAEGKSVDTSTGDEAV